MIVCCEYDALPGIGHGCGHNVIGTAGAGAGLALAALAEEAGGRVTILGTPAEEQGGGGKKRLLAAGAFADGDVAMMVHPEPGDVEYVPYLANEQLYVAMHGKAAHASSTPWAGVNALDALVLGYMAVAALRQHLRDDEKVHGIILDGGKADNIVPDHASARFRVRARTKERLEPLKARVLACFEGAAAQTGARLEHRWLGGYADMRSNRTLAAAYRRNGERLGRTFVDPSLIPASIAGSTDMGDVSYALPSIHPVIGMVPLGVVGHTEEFARWAGSEAGDRCVIDGAKALAMTGVDVWTRPDLLAEVRAEFATTATQRRAGRAGLSRRAGPPRRTAPAVSGGVRCGDDVLGEEAHDARAARAGGRAGTPARCRSRRAAAGRTGAAPRCPRRPSRGPSSCRAATARRSPASRRRRPPASRARTTGRS
ncbi:MAG: hypothetical protein KatS3mg009_3033 [Acidimicrobiia bacterium]|nr:MAG: hypothetical protein KatS3mg009_3033 [Acidimicrobiia bacterium]